jgi:hypothetical protein
MLSSMYPDLLDAKLSPYIQPQEVRERMSQVLQSNWQQHPDFDYSEYMGIQGIVDVDGGGWGSGAWSARFYQLLTTGAVVLKQRSPYKEFWYDLLEEYKHYIPVECDMSNLITQIKWLIQNESRGADIAVNEVEFVRKYLNKESWMNYARSVRKAYSALLVKPWTAYGKEVFKAAKEENMIPLAYATGDSSQYTERTWCTAQQEMNF